ncbi:prepilin-type N-terminal cleavage/methylation domain-containing protein [Paenibacillus sp. MBLB4367]|uniref:type IV pilus modification PilV family protein n=1 Tax=Paenibacillus sp. MBLB4367 TaxID=3384767 RepID=UPI003908375D
MKSEKGITLIELLVAIVIVTMLVLSISYLFTKTYENSYREEKKDVSVNIARTVMEELKRKLKTTSAVETIYEQPVNLAGLRQLPGSEIKQPSVYFPSASDKQYEIVISVLHFEDQNYPITDTNNKSFVFKLSDFFSLIQVEVKQHSMNTSYKVQSYMEIKGD